MADAKPQRTRETLAERAARRRERRRGWRTQDAVSTSGDRCMGKKATTVFRGINVAFAILGAVLIGMGIYGTQSTWAEFFGKGPGISVVCMGVAVIVTACVGIYGEKQDNKCLLLLYFLVLTFSFLVLIVMGAIATFDKGTINQKFSSWWDKYPDAAAKGQKDFNCCGYADMTDRPVGDCATEVPDATQGCKEVGLDYMRSRFVPLFLCAFVFGICQLVAIIVSMRLICRSTLKNPAPAMGVPGAAQWNAYTPDDDVTAQLVAASAGTSTDAARANGANSAHTPQPGAGQQMA